MNTNSLAGVSAILVRELRGRMRGRKAFVVLTLYLIVLGGLLYLTLGGLDLDGRSMGALDAANVGKGVFIGVILVETLVVAFLAPAYTGGSIAQEREKQTYDLLLVTPISPFSIAIGKLVSGLVYLLILILASIPVAGLGFFFGGLDPAAFIPPYIVLIAGAIGLGSVGLFFSALLKRTQSATIATYVCLIAGVVGPLFLGLFWSRITDSDASPPEAVYYFNPAFAQADVVCDITGEVGICSAVPGFREAAAQRAFGEGGAIEPAQFFEGTGTGFWVRSVLAWLGIAAVLLLGAARFISPTHRWRPRDLLRRAPQPPPSEAEA